MPDSPLDPFGDRYLFGPEPDWPDGTCDACGEQLVDTPQQCGPCRCRFGPPGSIFDALTPTQRKEPSRCPTKPTPPTSPPL